MRENKKKYSEIVHFVHLSVLENNFFTSTILTKCECYISAIYVEKKRKQWNTHNFNPKPCIEQQRWGEWEGEREKEHGSILPSVTTLCRERTVKAALKNRHIKKSPSYLSSLTRSIFFGRGRALSKRVHSNSLDR